MPIIGKQFPVAALTASDITDGIISNAKLAQDIISADTALGAEPADTDELLVSDAGVLKRMDYSYIKSSPGLVKLQSQTASSSSAITFSSTYITTTYKRYELHWYDVTISSDGGNITGTVSANNGGAYTTSNYYHWSIFGDSADANDSFDSSGATDNSALIMGGSGHGIGSGTDECSSGSITLFNPNSADSKLFITHAVHFSDTAHVTQQLSYQGLLSSTTYNNYKIAPNTGTIDTGTFTLYGVAT